MARLSQRVFTYKSIPSADDLPGLFITDKLFKGGFGTIYKGIDPISQQEIAIKYSKFDLSNEYKIMKKLNHISGIPKAYSFCELNKTYHITMEYLNQDLHTIQGKMKQLSLKTICFIAIKVLDILRGIHIQNIVHRDIKPSNLMVKSLEEQQIYLIDFGIAKEVDQITNQFEFEGTLLYDPIQSHKKLPYRFIDDVEMLSYTLLYLYKGQLPWMKVAQKVMAQNEVMHYKEQFLSSKLMSKLPFADLFGYIKWNQNTNMPDYDFLIRLFRKILQDNGFNENYTYDWIDLITPLNSAKIKTTASIFNDIHQEMDLSYTDLVDDESCCGIVSLQEQVYKFLKDCKY